MYVATQKIKSYFQGTIKKGQEVEFSQTWLDAGMIEEKAQHRIETETKPHIQSGMEDK